MILLFIHAAATFYMTGLIWFVQLVHYPLMARVGAEDYAEYQHQHEQRTGWAVGPAMLIELITAAWLVLDTPVGVAPRLAWLGLGLVALLWLSTAVLQIPCHKQLGNGFDPASHRRLIATNWLRTALWSGRGVIAFVMLGQQRPY